MNNKRFFTILFIFLLTTVNVSAQYKSYLHKNYAETMDSLEACQKRFEEAKLSLKDENIEWEKIKTFAIVHHDKRLELSVDFYLAYNQRYKEGIPEKELPPVYQNIIEQATKISFTEMIITCLYTQANLYSLIENYEACFSICKKLEQHLQNIDANIYPDKIHGYNAIADIYYKFKEFELTIQTLKKAIETTATGHNFWQHLNARNTLGLCYDKLNKQDSAMFYFQSIINENRFMDNPRVSIWKIIAQKNIADIYCHNGEYERSIPVYKNVFEYMLNTDEYEFGIGTAIALANSYIHIGNMKEAKNLFDNQLKRERIPNYRLAYWYESISLYYQKAGEYKMAIAYADSMLRLEKEAAETFNAMRLLRVEQQANALDMQLKNEQIVTEQMQKRNLLVWAVLLAVALLAVIVLLRIYVLLYKNKRDANLAMVRQIKEMQEQWELQEQVLLNKTLPTTELENESQNDDDLCPDTRKDRLCLALRDLLLKDRLYRDPNLTRDSMIALLATNKALFTESFQYCFNASFSVYVNHLRLKDAINLLENSDLSLEEIADKVGFGTLRTFQRQFRSEYGMSISDFRKLAQFTPHSNTTKF